MRRLVQVVLSFGSASVLALGCGSGGSGGAEASSDESSGQGAHSGAGSSGGEEGGTVVIIEDDDPRVSRSAGERRGVVVLFPRVMGIPDQEAVALQQHMVEVARRVFPNRPVDVRPDPERVCPRRGCEGVSLGALLVTQSGNCATVAVVGPPGPSELTLLRWSGRLTVRDRTVAFREPPESHITLHDSAPCTRLGADLQENDAAVEDALRLAAPPLD